MKRRIWHFLPSAALVVLLALVARAQTGNRAVVVTQVRPAGTVVPDARTGIRYAARPVVIPGLNTYQCNPEIQVTSTSTIFGPQDGRVLQPMYLMEGVNTVTIVAQSPSGFAGTIGIELVDPISGAPLQTYPLFRGDPSTVTADPGFDEAAVVTRLVHGVTSSADYLPALSLALDPSPGGYLLGVDDGTNGQYDKIPVARDQSQGLWAPMSGGPHMVLGHTVCTATALEESWVGEQRIAIDRSFQGGEMLQRFSCPATLTAERLELAVPQLAGTTSPIEIRFFEDDGTYPPSIPVTAVAFVIQPFNTGQTHTPTWMRSTPVSPSAEQRFRSGTKYWAYVTTNNWSLSAGPDNASTEDFLFKPGISTPFFPMPGVALGFRIIGRPETAVPPPPPPAGLSATYRNATGTATTPIDRLRVAQQLPENSPPIEMLQLALAGLPLDSSTGCTACTVTARVMLGSPGGTTPASDIYPLVYVAGGPTQTCCAPYWWNAMPVRSAVVRTVTGTPTYPHFAEVSSTRPGMSALYTVAQTVTRTALVARNGGTLSYSWEQLSGPLAVVSYRAATVTAALSAYDQQLRTTDILSPTPTAEILQTFRVPSSCQIKHVELALPGSAALTQPFDVIVLDSEGRAAPGSEPVAVTVTSTLFRRDATPPGLDVWMSSDDFSQPPVLVPGRDYWLVARLSTAGMALGTVVTQTADLEGRKFFQRTGPTGPFSYDASRALSFRIIASPVQTTGVDPIAGAHFLEFSVAPNPASQSFLFRWKGGSGRVSLEICDVSGRRVRRVTDAGPGTEGTWRWNGASDSGSKLPAGVYFARLEGPGGTVHRRVIRLD